MLSIPTILKSSTVIVTGGSGLLGASIILRLVQSDLQLTRIYAIVRSGENEKPEDRLVKELHPYLDERDDKGIWKATGLIRVIAGDCALDKLGLNKQDYKSALEADIFIHGAANTSFMRPLSILSVNIAMANVTAQFSLLSPKIKTHIHISTAMIGAQLPDKATFEEKLNPPKVYANHDNNYILSKSVGEGIVNSFASVVSDTNYAIVRVSVVAPALSFPVIAYGAETGSSPVVVGCICKFYDEAEAGKGWAVQAALQVASGKIASRELSQLDSIPVDISANQIIALTASTHITPRSVLPFAQGESVNIFHSATGSEGMKPASWNDHSIKIKVPFISLESILKNYTLFLFQTVFISTDKARFVYGLNPKSGLEIDSSKLVRVDCTGFEVDFDNFKAFGVVNYMRAIRD